MGITSDILGIESDDDGSTTTDDDGSYTDDYYGGPLDDDQREARADDPLIPQDLLDLKEWSDQLIKIAKNPKGFVIGTLLSVVLGGILEIWNLVIDGVRLVLFGSGPGYSDGEMMGLEDIIWLLWDILADPFEAVGEAILSTIEGFRSPIETLATELGVLSFPATVAFVVIVLVVATRIAKKLSRASLATIPVIGPALEVLLFK